MTWVQPRFWNVAKSPSFLPSPRDRAPPPGLGPAEDQGRPPPLGLSKAEAAASEMAVFNSCGFSPMTQNVSRLGFCVRITVLCSQSAALDSRSRRRSTDRHLRGAPRTVALPSSGLARPAAPAPPRTGPFSRRATSCPSSHRKMKWKPYKSK